MRKEGEIMDILKTKDLRKYYGTGETLVKALDGVSISVREGEFLAIVGTSGSGKSTLLHMLGGLDVPTSGQVIVDGRDLSGMERDELTVFRRRKIGFVFQNYNLLRQAGRQVRGTDNKLTGTGRKEVSDA